MSLFTEIYPTLMDFGDNSVYRCKAEEILRDKEEADRDAPGIPSRHMR